MRTLLFSAIFGSLSWSLGVSPTAHAAPPATEGGPQPALITLFVPSDAQIWLEDAATRQQGTVREYTSPPLAPGQDYIYTVRMRRMENGRPVEETRRLNVRAGEHRSINLTGKMTPPAAVPVQTGGDQRSYYYPPTSSSSVVGGGSPIVGRPDASSARPVYMRPSEGRD